ncbi:Efflux transporter periplasmic adaptor subunit [Gammaproteobacteria bacterium]
MKTSHPTQPSTLLTVRALVALAILLLAFVAAADTLLPTAKAALTVNTVVPTRAEWPLQLTANGTITAWQEAIVGAEINGLRLIEVLVNVGDRVRKGQELARLQSDTVIAERDQTRASLTETEAALAEAHANANRARQVEGHGTLSAQQTIQYLTVEKTAQARVAALKARLKADQLRLAQTHILAPDDGTISARTATLGAVAQSGQELFRLIRRDRLEWRAELPAADLVQIQPGMNVSITIASKAKVTGKVRIVAPTIDPQTRTGLVYVDLNNHGDAKAGMFARGEIEINHTSVLTLPQAAVMLRDGFSYIYRVGPDHRIIQTKVGVGQRSGELIAITNGLETNVPVVSSGVGFLSDGDLVRIITP